MSNVQVKFDSLDKSQQMEVIKFIDRLLKSNRKNQNDLFDEKIERDVNSGQLENIAQKALVDFKNQKFKKL